MGSSHLILMLLFYTWIPLALVGWYKTRKEPLPATKPRRGWFLVLNSAVLYALAYNLIFFIQELFLALGKYWLGLKAVLYHNNHNWYGSHPNDSLAQGYGALAIFICGLIFSVLFFSMRGSRGWGKVLVFWLAFQGLIQSLPQFATAVVDKETDTGQAFTWLGWSDTTGYLLMAGGIFLVVVIALSSSRLLLELAPTNANVTHPKRRFGYLFRGAFLAGLIGIALIFPFRIPPMDRALAPVLVTMISVPWIFANAWRVKEVKTRRNVVNERILWTPVFILLILLAVFQLVLAPGVVFE